MTSSGWRLMTTDGPPVTGPEGASEVAFPEIVPPYRLMSIMETSSYSFVTQAFPVIKTAIQLRVLAKEFVDIKLLSLADIPQRQAQFPH